MILQKAPSTITVFDYEFELNTSARVWLNISHNYNNLSNIKREEVLFNTIKNKEKLEDIPKEVKDKTERLKIYNRILEKLINFLNCGIKQTEDASNKQHKKLFDFAVDDAVIFSAFYRTYRIDIEEEIDNMHWWKFNALFNDLSSDCIFVSYYRYYRNYDTSTEYFKKLSDREKNIIYKCIDDVSLNRKEFKVKPISDLEKRRQKAKELKNG